MTPARRAGAMLAAAVALALAGGCTGAGEEAGGAVPTTVDGRSATVPALRVDPPPAQRDWAPAATATIRPGVQTRTDGGQCTANFIFLSGADLLIGQAAHCSTLGSPFDLDGCATDSLPLGTEVEIAGARRPGTLVYSSWRAMRAAGEGDREACRFNDLALVRIHPADHGRVNPTLPVFGGPTGVNSGGVPTGQPVVSFGNSLIRLGIDALNLNQGVSVARRAEGWTHKVLTLTPGIPGDSGSAFLDPRGRALGALSTAGGLGTSDVTDIGRALAYANAHSDLPRIRLATGTEPFSPLGEAPPLVRERPAQRG